MRRGEGRGGGRHRRESGGRGAGARFPHPLSGVLVTVPWSGLDSSVRLGVHTGSPQRVRTKVTGTRIVVITRKT